MQWYISRCKHEIVFYGLKQEYTVISHTSIRGLSKNFVREFLQNKDNRWSV